MKKELGIDEHPSAKATDSILDADPQKLKEEVREMLESADTDSLKKIAAILKAKNT